MAKDLIIDADAHFNEPDELWDEYLEKKYRYAAPKIVTDNQGRPRGYVGSHMLPPMPQHPTHGTGVKRAGRNDAKLRLADMDREGIDIMAMYPTKGLFFFSVKEVDTQAALCRAYNNWARDFCSEDPKRLIAPGLLPQLDVGEMIVEAERALGDLGMHGVLLRPNPIGGRNLDSPALEPLWHLLEERGAPLVLHEGCTQDVPQVGFDRFENFLYRHMMCHAFEMQIAVMSLIMGGVLERHPKLNVLVVECGVGWVPYWMDRMDDHQVHWGHASLPLKMKPSDYFRRQIFVAAEGAEHMLPQAVDAFGDDNFCFSTDYPHPDHPFDGVVEELRNMEGLSAESKRKILGANAARLFSL